MRVVLDANVLISALIAPEGASDRLYHAWRGGRFQLITSEDQLEEFRRVTRSPRLRPYLHPAAAGAMLNEIKSLAQTVKKGPPLTISKDPADNFLLEMAQSGSADYLVTGDKHDLLHLRRHQSTHIVTVRRLLDILEK